MHRRAFISTKIPDRESNPGGLNIFLEADDENILSWATKIRPTELMLVRFLSPK